MIDTKNIVFTGAATDCNGAPIVRSALAIECLRHGLNVQSAVKPTTQLLIASRADTAKARAAAACGVQVLSYSQFLAAFLPNAQFS